MIGRRQFKRLSTEKIQSKLTSDNNVYNNKFGINTKKSDLLKKTLPENYFYFHAKKKKSLMSWGGVLMN